MKLNGDEMKPTTIRSEVFDVIGSYCGKKLVSRFLAEQKKIDRMEKKLALVQAGRGKNVGRKVAQGGSEWYDHLITMCKNALSDHDYQEALLQIGSIYKLHGQLKLAEQIYAEAIHHGNQSGETDLLAEAFLLRGEVYSRQGRWAESGADLEQSRRLFVEANSISGLARLENIVGTNMAEQGLLKEAQSCFSTALTNSENAGEKLLSATIFMNLGNLQNILGNCDEALNFHRRALSLFERSGNLLRIAEAHHNIGMSHITKDELRNAKLAFDKSLEYSMRISSPGLMGLSKLGKATVCLLEGDLALALALCNQAHAHFALTNDRLSIADQYKVKGMILRETNKFDLAAMHFDSSLRINEEHNNLLNMGETLFEIGIMERRRRLNKGARDAFNRSIACFQKVGARLQHQRAIQELDSIKGTR